MLNPDKVRAEKIYLSREIGNLYRDAAEEAVKGKWYWINKDHLNDLKLQYERISPWEDDNYDGSDSDYGFDDYYGSIRDDH